MKIIEQEFGNMINGVWHGEKQLLIEAHGHKISITADGIFIRNGATWYSHSLDVFREGKQLLQKDDFKIIKQSNKPT